MGINIKQFKIILWLILAIFVFWLFWQAVVPTGGISYRYDFRQENYFIKKLTPKDRVREPQAGPPASPGEAWRASEQKIVGNPVYFSLRTPRTFDRAKVTVSFKNPDKLPLIEIGALAADKVWRYRLEPLENLALDRLIERWPVVREGDVILLQRNKKYSNLNDFLAQQPQREEIALYNYQLPDDFILNAYQAGIATTTINVSLRGTYQFYTYIGAENLYYEFSLSDLNQNKDSDAAILKLYHGQTLVAERQLADDGIAADTGVHTAPRSLTLNKTGLAPGVYKIELLANDDILTEKIKTRQTKLALINRVWFVDGAEKPLKLFTDSLKISVQTLNPASLQDIKVGDGKLSLADTYRQFAVENQAGLIDLKLNKGDVIISGDGLFSFSREQFFNPERKKFSSRLDLDKNGINYILARYHTPAANGNRQTASAEFDLKNAYREFFKYNFMISIPDLNAEDRVKDSLIIDDIRVDLTGTNLWQKIKKIILKE